jgi:DNA-binding IscR family transcriptional regulator
MTGGAITLLIHAADRVGLFEAASVGPATSSQLASRAALSERHVRELLGGLTAAGIFSYDPTARR